jgi:hypothetical protein
MRITRRAAIGGMVASVARPGLAAKTPMTYLLPAPATLPAFLPFQSTPAMRRRSSASCAAT